MYCRRPVSPSAQSEAPPYLSYLCKLTLERGAGKLQMHLLRVQ